MKQLLLASSAIMLMSGYAFAAGQMSTTQPTPMKNSANITGKVSFLNPKNDTILVRNQRWQVSKAEFSKLKLGDQVVLKPSPAHANKGTNAATIVSITG